MADADHPTFNSFFSKRIFHVQVGAPPAINRIPAAEFALPRCPLRAGQMLEHVRAAHDSRSRQGLRDLHISLLEKETLACSIGVSVLRAAKGVFNDWINLMIS